MHQMMDRLDVDALVIMHLRNGEAYAEARWRCLRCEESCMCLHWLDKGAPDAGPDFCPNLEFFNACKILASRSFSAWGGPLRSGDTNEPAQTFGGLVDLSGRRLKSSG